MKLRCSKCDYEFDAIADKEFIYCPNCGFKNTNVSYDDTSEKIVELLDKVKERIREKDLKKAIFLLETVLEIDPRNEEANYVYKNLKSKLKLRIINSPNVFIQDNINGTFYKKNYFIDGKNIMQIKDSGEERLITPIGEHSLDIQVNGSNIFSSKFHISNSNTKIFIYTFHNSIDGGYLCSIETEDSK
jgi:predicted  nucleic acid-binding Zn-ribbon protein